MDISNEMMCKNYSIFLHKLQSVGVDTDQLDKTFGQALKEGTYSMSNKHSVACSGSLLHFVLRVLTPYAININSILPEELQVDKKSLILVCLLSQIGKAVSFIPNDNDWEIQKEGLLYKNAPTTTSLKIGGRSLFMSTSCGISFSEEEYDAIQNIDADKKNDNISMLSIILNQAIALTNAQLTLLKEHINE